MTPDLHHRLERSIAPFDGMCVHDVDGLSMAELRALLEFAVSWLKPRYPNIRSFCDWHEHDGFLVESKTDSWNALIVATATEQTLLDSRNEDWQVRIAFYPTDFDWLLRYNIDLEDETDRTTASCNFDLTLAIHTDASELITEILGRLPGRVVKSEAAPWFRANYGG